ncbi:pepsin-like aspartyl protease [Pseudomonas sp. L1(2025)]|uniref:pepsin-like aspartyl protease n=1 Tax=Pseudomonas sp. L1(2025) TaxID=3449429 RepID=UPI003F68BDAE
MNNEHRVEGMPLAMQRGPYQNNGATPWYSTLHVGTPGQPLKLSLDTGTNITWVTSSLCASDRCQHYSAGRFDYQASSSFTLTDCL